jgi:hypothetical protein
MDPSDRAGAPARDDDAQPDYRRGPGRPLEGRVWPPGSHGAAANPRTPGARASDRPPNARDLCPRGCGKAHGPAGHCPLDDDPDHPGPGIGPPARGGPPAWYGPRANPPPEVAKRGRALADAALAERPGRPVPEHDDDPHPLAGMSDEQLQAVARAQAARSRRERDPMTEPTEHRPPERELGDPPVHPDQEALDYDAEPEPTPDELGPDPDEPDPAPWGDDPDDEPF